jgi:hypothetical protein
LVLLFNKYQLIDTFKGEQTMTELTLKVDDHIASKFKQISMQKFHGDETLAFESAVKHLLSMEEQEMIRLEQIVDQIQDEIETAGGITDQEIDALIAAYRLKKRSQRK